MISCTLNGNRISIYDYDKETLKKWANKKILLCPACGKPYEVCWGKVISPYFRHLEKSECEDKYFEPETEEHIKGKIALYNWVKNIPGVTNCELEGWIPETKQRPDVMFEYNKKVCVLEYQCTPIATEYYERHELYHAAGIIDIWICGTKNFFNSNRRKVIEKEAKLYFDSSKSEFILNYKDSYYPASMDKFNISDVVLDDTFLLRPKNYISDWNCITKDRYLFFENYCKSFMKIITENFNDFNIDIYDHNTLNYKNKYTCFEIDPVRNRFTYFKKSFRKDHGRWICDRDIKSTKTFYEININTFREYVRYFFPEAMS